MYAKHYVKVLFWCLERRKMLCLQAYKIQRGKKRQSKLTSLPCVQYMPLFYITMHIPVYVLCTAVAVCIKNLSGNKKCAVVGCKINLTATLCKWSKGTISTKKVWQT